MQQSVWVAEQVAIFDVTVRYSLGLLDSDRF
jgi:hypothetical protein